MKVMLGILVVNVIASFFIWASFCILRDFSGKPNEHKRIIWLVILVFCLLVSGSVIYSMNLLKI